MELYSITKISFLNFILTFVWDSGPCAHIWTQIPNHRICCIIQWKLILDAFMFVFCLRATFGLFQEMDLLFEWPLHFKLQKFLTTSTKVQKKLKIKKYVYEIS